MGDVPIYETDVNNDGQLIEAARNGDSSAFGQLVERYQDRLYNTLVRYIGSAEDAQDIAQEAFIRAMEKLDSFRGTAAFFTWLYRIGFNLAISRQRRRKPAVSIDTARELAGVEPVDLGGGPEKRLMQRELAAQVHRALRELNDQHRQIVLLREIEDCDYETISGILGIPVGTVRSRLFRARMQLRKQLMHMLQEEMEEYR
ncbi:MAG: sigma-70 family RNA polymerase sigma factor [Pirellulales bacterium]|nr:sigma-70 family RNA polymerase sigma factor [Pirellulales bacterium]